MKKRFGQNFMVDPHARSRIVGLLPPPDKQGLWEIGPGFGALTHQLLESWPNLLVFEIDHGFISVLNREFGERAQFRLVAGDVRQTWKAEAERMPRAVIGNLPYRTGSIIIAEFLEEGFLPQTMVYTLQREVVRRITARPGSPDYSGFSVLCQSYYLPADEGEIGAGAFFPRPEVTSGIVRMERVGDRQAPNDARRYAAAIRLLFSSRRKTLKNNIKTLAAADPTIPFELALAAAQKVGLDPSSRAEEHSAEGFLAFAAEIGL